MHFLVWLMARYTTHFAIRKPYLLRKHTLGTKFAVLGKGRISNSNGMVRPTAAMANNSAYNHGPPIGLLIVATHALKRKGIDIGTLFHLRHIGNGMPGLLQRNSGILHTIEEFRIVTGKTQILAVLITTEQARLRSMNIVAGTARHVVLPIQGKSSRQLAIWRKAGGMTHPLDVFVTYTAQRFLRGN